MLVYFKYLHEKLFYCNTHIYPKKIFTSLLYLPSFAINKTDSDDIIDEYKSIFTEFRYTAAVHPPLMFCIYMCIRG